ncbi:beta-L-arabinofuranosidase domain-containing protein [Paenibacillus sp. 7523-1]|uniref:beta-L-arabinofuranosidase domain-containing protein n=1 Tax=Paenibacillus sp. 7523-1 TaxID=2022550 RepID=UPI000BA6F57D|nr:beta-L-arabinofuranosidase domain-containing protein [Paenibacillus sp. 7523-1]PAD29278.1 glycosyl hydrolase [Paenibacillus sp. 7523-1]
MIETKRGFLGPEHVQLLNGVFQTSQEVGERYLLSLDIDRFLAPCYEAHGLTAKKERYAGWEARTISGHSLGHYMSALAVTYQATGNETLKQTLDYAVNELAGIQKTTGSGYIGGLTEEAFHIAFRAEHIGGFNIGEYWVPWYSVHKIYRGLIDAYTRTGNGLALEVVTRFADWAVEGLLPMTEEQMQTMLQSEHGGMNEVFAQLYGITGKAVYLEIANKFTHQLILGPLEHKQDDLQGKHANTQIPKVIGAAEIYNQDQSRESYRTAAEFFWDTTIHHRSYVFGATSISEHYEAKGMESLGIKTGESCCTHNMMHLTKQLFAWNPDSAYMDYYENAIYNHILGTQDPDTGNKTYFASTLQGHYKIYGTHDTAWWCCTGSGLENPGKYAEAIYFEDEQDLYVNLYIASGLDWTSQGLSLKLETDFPYSEKVTLTITGGRAPANLRLRVPSWLEEPMTATVNGDTAHPYTRMEAGYLSIQRTWSAGDVVTITLPMSLSRYTSRDDTHKVAFLYGPIVLAGALGSEGLPEDTIVDETALNPKTATVPVIWTEQEDVREWIKVVDKGALTFELSKDVTSTGEAVKLVPFYDVHHEFYTVYWPFNDEGDALEKELNAITIDRVQPDGQQDEIGHQLDSNCRAEHHNGSYTDSRNRLHMWREAFGVSEAYFSYRLAVDGSGTNVLCVGYWGGDHSPFEREGTRYDRTFNLLVDGTVVGEQRIHLNKIGEVFYATYDIPQAVTSGKESVTVTFQAIGDHGCAGKVVEVRTTRSKPNFVIS